MMDSKFQIRMRLLLEQSQVACFKQGINPHKAPAVLALVKDKEYRFFSFGHEEAGEPLKRSLGEGFKMLGGIALSFTEDGKPLIEDEMLDGVDPKQVQAARELFTEELIAGGVLRAGTASA